MIYGKPLQDSISNQIICGMTGVEKKEEFMKEQRLRWFGHVKKMDDKRTPVKAQDFIVDGLKKGRPKNRWKVVVEKNMLLEV